MNFLGELKRRNVFRVGIAYLLGAWVLLQIADFILQVIDAPPWVLQVLVLLAGIGLPAVLVFSWVFEMTPEGIKRETEIDRSRSIAPQTGHKLDRAIIGFLAAAVVVLLIDRFWAPGDGAAAVAGHESAARTTEPPRPAASENTPSIAVLPFVNMSSDPEQEYFSDGLAEELLNRLAAFDQLRVAARTSSFQFKGQNLDVADIGRQLRVDHVLEGSVRKSGNRLRITAQLIDADQGFHLWSETYERELDDVFGIQDEISSAITRALQVELGMEETHGPPTDNLEAYQLFLQARFMLAKRGRDNMRRAIELFERSVALDPQFGRAWSGLAFTWSLLPSYSDTSTELARGRVLEASQQAVALDPQNPEPYVALGRIQSNFDGDLDEARRNFEKAYALAPKDVDVVNLYGDFLFLVGKLDEGEAMERRAVEMDPLAAVHYSDLAFLLLVRRKNAEALELGRTSARLAPDVIDRQDALFNALARNGRFEEARRLLEEAAARFKDDAEYINTWRCVLAYERGDAQSLRESVRERLRRSEEWGFNANTIAAWYTLWLDGAQAALPLLEKAKAEEEYMLTWPEYFFLPEMLSNDPDFLAFWEQPGFEELMAARRANWNGGALGYWKERPTE